MPQLGESIAEATLLRMDVAPGDSVQTDQEIMEVETQKATMSVTIPCSGVVEELTCEVGVSYPVGSVLGYLTVSDEEAARAGVVPEPSPPAPESKDTSPLFREGAAAFSANSSDTGYNGSAPAAGSGEDDTAGLHFRVDSSIAMTPSAAGGVHPTLTGLPVPVNAGGAHYISPRLRARMTEMGLNAADLSAVAGSGSGGRVTVEDFEAFMAQLDKHRTTPASPMRIAVADSMRRSWTRPLATVGIRVNLDPMLAHRRQTPADLKAGPALYFLRALAIALSENTALAGRLVGNRIIHPSAIDLGFAVEVEAGVLVPVIRDANTRTLADMVPLYNDLVQRARARKLPPEARGPGIATITNFGTFGILWATPIPLPEQTLLMGLGAGEKSPVWDPVTESFQPQTQADLTLSFDHRVLDGGGAGRLLSRVTELMGRPETL
ncbi:MAG: 2-oxo acid dehydrogenase subunit E2 [Verrucomicrobiaceae bacterium]|nr:MAG: 2-oxo acid dehydrogenase subunit E2 [Verrucomicrobiaceae bacterium]